MRSVFIQILMTRFFDLIVGNSLKRWLQQQDRLLRSQMVEATTQNTSKPSENCSSNYRAKFTRCWRAESQEHAVQRKICEELNSRMKYIVQLTRETFCFLKILCRMSISEVLVKTCWSNATTAKIWNLPNFCHLFAHQKLEVNKIDSSATRPISSISIKIFHTLRYNFYFHLPKSKMYSTFPGQSNLGFYPALS